MTRIVPGPSSQRGRGGLALRAGLLVLLLTSCDRQSEITVYRLPKEAGSDVQPAAPADTDTAPASVRWTAPAGWQEQPATGFRKGSFSVPGPGGQKADVSVVSFPSSAGGLLENVNRWRGQLKLDSISEDDLQDAVTAVPVAGQTVQLVDLVSAQPMPAGGGTKSRILGGILALPGETWFFKMTGPDALVASQRNAFRQFLQSLQIQGGTDAGTPAVADANAATPPPGDANGGGTPPMPDANGAGTPPMADMNPAPASTDAPTPPMDSPPSAAVHYDLPPGWKEKPLTPMRVASFNVPGGPAGNADASIVVLSGAAGGELSNINRWRGQIGLPPMSEQALDTLTTHLQANGHDYILVDLVGAKPAVEQKSKARILVAMLSENNQSWFVKMIGPDQVVGAQRDAFIGLVKNLRFSP